MYSSVFCIKNGACGTANFFFQADTKVSDTLHSVGSKRVKYNLKNLHYNQYYNINVCE